MAKVKHSDRKHALLSASGAERWMACTPSARLEDKFEEKTSVYAEEGTLAHEFADLEKRFHFGQVTKGVYNAEIKKLRKHKLYTDEMEGEVTKYVDIVKETFEAAKQRTPDAVILIEERLDFSHIVENGFGTGDTVIVADKDMEVVDLKYGKGVEVVATDNPQLKLYGLGALQKFEMLYDIETVRLTIIQPRLDHYSTFEISVADLVKWGEEEVKPKAKLAYVGEGKQTPGAWCKFCKAKPICRALQEQNLALAKHEFRDPQVLSDSELLEVYKQLPIFSDWAASVNAHMLEEAKKGKQWAGFKLVAGRSVRKWADEQKVLSILEKNQYDSTKYLVTKLAGIPAVEKLVGKKPFPILLKDMVVKPEGAPTLVPESDKRPALGVEQAKLDFKED